MGQYVVGLKKENMKIAVNNGTVFLENLEINKTLFETLNFPITVKRGCIGKLKVVIPWTSLDKDPTSLYVEDICLLVVPKEAKYDQDYKNKEQLTKERALQILQLTKQEMYEAPKEAPKKEKKGFVDKLQERVLRNVIVEVKNIHIRYEDELSIPNVNRKIKSIFFSNNTKKNQSTLSFGIYLDSLLMKSADEKWNPKILTKDEKVIRKV